MNRLFTRQIAFLILLGIGCLLSGEMFAQGQVSGRSDIGQDASEQKTRGRRGSQSRVQQARDQRRGSVAQQLRRLDRNGDGRLAKEELPARLQNAFDRIDANQDGAIDALELALAQSSGRRDGAQGINLSGTGANQQSRRRENDNKGGQDRMQTNPRGDAVGVAGVNLAQLLQRADRNRDGVISKQEMPEPLRRQFETYDLNGDGNLDRNEIASVRPVDRRRAGNDQRRPQGNQRQQGAVKPKRPPRLDNNGRGGLEES